MKTPRANCQHCNRPGSTDRRKLANLRRRRQLLERAIAALTIYQAARCDSFLAIAAALGTISA